MVVFPQPFFSSDVGASKRILKNQNIIEAGESSQKTTYHAENDAREEKNFECTIRDKGTTAEDQEAPTCAGVTKLIKGDCNGGYSWNTSTSHYLFVPNKMNWDSAKDDCYSYNTGAHLVFIESDAENEEVICSIGRVVTGCDLSGDVWLGITYDKQTQTWKWYNRTADTQTNGPRKIVKLTKHENCVRIHTNSNEWRGTQCSKKCFFICEVNMLNL